MMGVRVCHTWPVVMGVRVCHTWPVVMGVRLQEWKLP